jgi:hypothetical protein
MTSKHPLRHTGTKRESEKERERGKERETKTQTTHRARHINAQRKRQANTCLDTLVLRETSKYPLRYTGRERERERERQRESKTH